jgi:hypothetical protein
MRCGGVGIAALGLAVLFAAPPAAAQCELAELHAPEPFPGDLFGLAVSVSAGGEYLLIGAPQDDETAIDAGAAHVYRRLGMAWLSQATLRAQDGASGDQFGRSVSIAADGLTALIGAWREGDTGFSQRGAAYIFTRNGSDWTQSAKMVASDAQATDQFGVSVSLDAAGETAVIGAWQDDHSGLSDVGAAYVFDRRGAVWSQVTKLTAPAADAGSFDNFGLAVAAAGEGGFLVIGAPFDDHAPPGPMNAGSAFVYRLDPGGWVLESRLSAMDAASNDWLGGAVAISASGFVVLAGARLDDHPGGTNAGSAYAFKRFEGFWSQHYRLRAPDAAADDEFGADVALSAAGDRALIGAYRDDDAGESSGAAYLHRDAGISWPMDAKLITDAPMAGDEFGRAVAIAPDAAHALVGAWVDADAGPDAGAAAVFAINGPDCNDNAVIDACDIRAGTSGDSNANGIPDECEPGGIPGDLDQDGEVDVTDLLMLLSGWGPCPPPPPPPPAHCPADLNGNGLVNVTDLLLLLSHWTGG